VLPTHLIAPQAGFGSDIGKRAVAVVAIEEVVPPIGNEDVFEAVVVLVAHGYAAGSSGEFESGRARVRERWVWIPQPTGSIYLPRKLTTLGPDRDAERQ
jgi:hypothetical protein